ncbi:ABC1 family-domain-containing protein [Emericellopsis atlantica]|uniref:ABC1 family-domain-containing protein n=1 Tax=Emericellopsis atlantica TaxID=2614577 RepID=A0A9P7ZUR8_9HYPO|nr:ABC1 family-domain-containing protein [Emericellopsis atlantica]KAG9258714.1 ABC1 family-domain-containing protein [Emericellopsis atlantica]
MFRQNILGASRGLARAIPRRCRAQPSPITIIPRRFQSGGPFQPLRPPSPSELGAPKAAKEYKKGRRWGRRLVLLAAVGGLVYVVDGQLFSFGLLRSARTFSTGLIVALDYKMNFRPNPWVGGDIQDLHARSARRVFHLLQDNGGLYLKVGQAIAMQSAVLPPEFQKMFAQMFDDAPQDDWKDVEAVIREDFGKSVEEVFGVSFTGKEGYGVMERKAKASASVAQVHWAKLTDGREIAIKVQKREISKQRSMDLWSFKTVTWIYSKWFDIPYYKLVPFIIERLELEMDFENEAQNSETMRVLIQQEKKLKGRVYIPTVYPELTSKRVLTTEWIEGVRLWDKQTMTSRWLGGYGKGSPGAGEPLPPADMDALRREARTKAFNESLKPNRDSWKGPRGKGGLGVSTKEVMTTMVDLFSAQIYKWGVVHCDPHPGNIFIRRLPSGKAELVLIDHGLYVYLTDEFRHQYSVLWKALMTFDNKTIADVTEKWGIKSPDLFSTATLLRPYEGGEKIDAGMENMTPSERSYAIQQKMKQGVRDMLADEDKWPKELLFLGRNMRIVQGNNQYMGSPVNRLKMMGEWASSSLYQDPKLSWDHRLSNAFRHLIFKVVMTASDVAFYFYMARSWLGLGSNMEDAMEQRMREMASEYGVELQGDVFEG